MLALLFYSESSASDCHISHIEKNRCKRRDFEELIQKTVLRTSKLCCRNRVIKGTLTDIWKTVFRKVLFRWYSMPIFSFIGYTLTELFRKPDNWRQIYKQTSSTFNTSNDMSLKHVEKKQLLRRHNNNISLTVCWRSHLCEMAV